MNRILVIDDELDFRTGIQVLLTQNNFIAETISKPEYLYYSVEYFKPDLILLDIALGDADGRRICHTLKAESRTRNIPIILFSAHHNLISDLDGCTPDGIIAKPFEPSYLIDIINKTLEKNNSYSVTK